MGELLFLLGLVEGLEDQRQRVLVPQAVSDNEAIEQVSDNRQIGPALLGGNVGDIGDPFLVGLAGVKLPVEQIVIVMVGFRGRQLAEEFPPASHRVNVELVHEPQDRLVVDPQTPLFLQPQGDPPVAIRPA